MHYNVMAGVAVRYIPGATGEWQQFYDDGEITVMQFTGFKDKNGRNIYEDDIVISNLSGETDFMVDVIGDIRHLFPLDSGRAFDNKWLVWEVLGNIWEHPHLIFQPVQ